MRYEADSEDIQWWSGLTPEERWEVSRRLWAIYTSLTETEQRVLMKGDDTLAPGETRWRLRHYLGWTDADFEKQGL